MLVLSNRNEYRVSQQILDGKLFSENLNSGNFEITSFFAFRD